LKEKKSRGSNHSSPEFGKDRSSEKPYDYNSLINEIEKRKESLNTIQSMLGIVETAKHQTLGNDKKRK
jgi:hypothetical protein